MLLRVVSVLAAVGVSVCSVLPNDHLSYLIRRQDVPAECAGSCIPVNTIIASQCSVSKCCNAPFENAYSDCVECFARSIQLTNFAPYQAAFDTLFAACSRADQPISKLTFPGQNANRNILSTSATITRSQTLSLPPSSARPSATGEITPVASSSPPIPQSSAALSPSSQVTSASSGTASLPISSPSATAPPSLSASGVTVSETSTLVPSNAGVTSEAAVNTPAPSPSDTSNAAATLKRPTFAYGTVHLLVLTICFVMHVL